MQTELGFWKREEELWAEGNTQITHSNEKAAPQLEVGIAEALGQIKFSRLAMY